MIKVSPEVIGKQVRCLRAHPFGSMNSREPIGMIRGVTSTTAHVLFIDPQYDECGTSWWYMLADLEGYNGD